jgi:hypothetical protein
MAAFKMNPGNEGDFEKMREMLGPVQIDQLVRQAIQFCWIGLPYSSAAGFVWT